MIHYMPLPIGPVYIAVGYILYKMEHTFWGPAFWVLGMAELLLWVATLYASGGMR